jgi:hypothetical protein
MKTRAAITFQHEITLLHNEVPEDDDGVRALAIKLDLTGTSGLFPLLLADHRPMERRLALEGPKQWMRARRDEIVRDLTLLVSGIAMLAAIAAAARLLTKMLPGPTAEAP